MVSSSLALLLLYFKMGFYWFSWGDFPLKRLFIHLFICLFVHWLVCLSVPPFRAIQPGLRLNLPILKDTAAQKARLKPVSASKLAHKEIAIKSELECIEIYFSYLDIKQ